MDERQRCGCPLDYHLADCPLLTERSATSDFEMYGPNGPDDDDFDPRAYDDEEDEEAEREFERDRAEHEVMYYKEVTGR